mmetsp:Transcript_2708/g.4735  ORF Transcript_2708/g.4735 Transcript_2708/m.4735 type:complete len:187 (+) Transcript_2708:173-733(+)
MDASNSNSNPNPNPNNRTHLDRNDPSVKNMFELMDVIRELMDRCSFVGDVSAYEIIKFAKSELDEIQLEMCISDAHNDRGDRRRSLETGGMIPGSNTPLPEKSDTENLSSLQTELGDLIFNSLLLASVLQRDYPGIKLDKAIETVIEKVVRRSPHVFGNEVALTRKEAEALWQREKAKESKPKSNP